MEFFGGYCLIVLEMLYVVSVLFGDIENVFDLLVLDMVSDVVLFGVVFGGEGGLVSFKVGYDVKIFDDGMVYVLGGMFRLKF